LCNFKSYNDESKRYAESLVDGYFNYW
jgi:hypothetical protein